MNQRNEGFIEALKEYPDVTIKEETVEECTAEGGQKLTDNLLIANPEGTLDIIYGSNAGVALGALASVSSAGREDIALVGIDNEEGQLNALKDGKKGVCDGSILVSAGSSCATEKEKRRFLYCRQS